MINVYLCNKISTAYTNFDERKNENSKQRKTSSNDPFIVVCTHKSWIDVVCLGIALYPTLFTLWLRKSYLIRFLSKSF
ncbi:1-acyl-sn-glycerol-3-phosphate acyltransferase [Priestia megaterium]